MKLSLKSIFSVTGILPLVILLPLGGCAGESQTEPPVTDSACIEMMQKIPADYEDFEFWDVNALRGDPDLEDMYQVWYERKVQYLEEHYSINSSGIDYLATGDGLLNIYKTGYDIEPVRGKIQDGYYRDTAYKDIEVWKSQPSREPQSPTGGWVLADGLLVRGSNNSNVDDYLRVVSDEESSLYSRENILEMLDMLPEGIVIRISSPSYSQDSPIAGMAVTKEPEGVLKWTNIFLFEGSEDEVTEKINEYYNNLESEFNRANELIAGRDGSPLFSDVSLEREGNIIKFSMVVEIQYMIAVLFYG